MKQLAVVFFLILASAGAWVSTRLATAPPPVLPRPAPTMPAPAPEPPPDPHGPRIRFEKKTEGFGSVAHGVVVTRSFAFKNEGEAELVLTSVRTSCGCTAALPSKRRLAPGESAAVEVSFDTSRKPAFKERTPYTNSVMVMSNDRAERDAGVGVSRLVLEGEVIARYRVIPDSGAIMPAMQRGAPMPASVTLTVVPLADGVKLGGATIAAAPSWVKIEGPRATTRDGKEALEIRVTLTPDVGVGPIDGSILVKTGDAQQPEVTIPVRGVVMPKVQAAPPRLFIATGAPARPLMLSAVSPIRVLAVEVLADDGLAAPIAVATPLPEPAPRMSFQIGPAPGVEPRGATGEVRFFLADREMPIVTVPFRVQDQAKTRAAIELQKTAGVRVSPIEVDLGEVPAGQEPETSITIQRAGPQMLDVRDIAVSPAGAFEARLEPVLAGQTARVVVKARAGGHGPLAGEVRFRPREGAEFVAVPVSGRSLGTIAASPPALFLAGEEASSTRLRRADGKPVTIVAARESTGALEVSVGAESIAAHARAGAPHGSFRGAITVETDGGPLVIPVFGEN